MADQPSTSTATSQIRIGGRVVAIAAAVAADRRSISESGVDSGASDSGVGSNVSQASLPTTTPPTSPGYHLTVNSAVRPHIKPTSRDQRTSIDNGALKAVPAVPVQQWTTAQRALHQAATAKALADMPRSRSHESHLTYRVMASGAQHTPDGRQACICTGGKHECSRSCSPLVTDAPHSCASAATDARTLSQQCGS
jgi:hypothetical protein